MNLNKLLKRLLLFLAVMLCNISIQAQYITKALDENDESTFKWENASNFILFDVGEAEREAMEGKILADYNIDDVTRHLYIWDGTYVGGDGSGMNSFGQLEDHIALTVANVGWSGFSMIKDGGIDLSMLDDTYVLHFAMKAKPTDFTSHGFGFAQAKFTIGPNAFVDGHVSTNCWATLATTTSGTTSTSHSAFCASAPTTELCSQRIRVVPLPTMTTTSGACRVV